MILKNWNSVERETGDHLASLARDAERGRRDVSRVRRFVGRLLRRWGERLDPPGIVHASSLHASSSPAAAEPRSVVESPTA